MMKQKKSPRDKKNPRITIISPCYNMVHFVDQTIESVLSQSFTNFEYIIVDAASTDGTLERIKHFAKKDKRIKWISEKDKGYHDAMLKGLKVAKGEFLMELMVSDGYKNKDWLKLCVEVLDADPEVSLVWGFPQWLEEGKFTDVTYPHFHHQKVPQKQKWFSYWLATGEAVPNGNYCVRRNVFIKCNPDFNDTINGREFWDFNYAFNTKGYLAYCIPVVADWGRAHPGQLSEGWLVSGKVFGFMKHYYTNIEKYKKNLLAKKISHVFKDGEGKEIGKFDTSEINPFTSPILKGRILFYMVLQRGPKKIRKAVKKFIHV